MEEFCSLKNILKESFEKSSNKFKIDFSKNIMKQLDIKEEYYKGGSQLKVASIFIFLLTSLVIASPSDFPTIFFNTEKTASYYCVLLCIT